jgi:hypothetical protein
MIVVGVMGIVAAVYGWLFCRKLSTAFLKNLARVCCTVSLSFAVLTIAVGVESRVRPENPEIRLVGLRLTAEDF